MLDLPNLHQYQKDIANFILNRRAAFVIAEMGLGKTIPTLLAIQHLQEKKGYKSALILGPLRVIYNSWPQEKAKWKPTRGMKHHILHNKGKTPYPPKVPLYLSNYETLPYIIKHKLHKLCDILVLDESSLIKTHKTKRFKYLKQIRKQFKMVILLTGTPSPSGDLKELFSQVYMIDQGARLGSSFFKFREKYYYKADWFGYDYRLHPGAREAIKNKIRDITIVFAVKDNLDMPNLVRNLVLVDIPTKARSAYKTLEKDFIIDLKAGVVTAANAAVLSGKLRQITAGGLYHEDKSYTLLHMAKIEALKEIIEGTSSNIICCFQFKFEQAILKRTFPGARFMSGGTSATESNEIINSWNNKKIKLLFCQPQSCSMGLNIQDGGHVLVWLSPDWSLERTIQMDARVYRQGQKERVIIHNIAVDGSIDLAVLEALRMKNRGQKALLDALLIYAKGAGK